MSVVVSVRTVVVFGDYWRRNYACRTTVVFILFTYIDCVQPVFFYFIAIGRCLIRRCSNHSSYILFFTTPLMFSRNNSP